MKTFILVKLLVCALFLATGCSVRRIPLDQSIVDQDPTIEYAGGYGHGHYNGNSIDNPRFVADAWRMSRYYRGNAPSNHLLSTFDYQPSDRLNVDPNPYDSYRSGEAPIMRAPAQNTTQPIQNAVETRRRTRNSQTPDWRRSRFVDQTRVKERQVHRSLKQRRQTENTNDVDESNKENSRQKTRKRTRGRKQTK